MALEECRWIRRPDPVCCTEGCQFDTARRLMTAAQALIIERRDGVSYALWCDRGGHAFSENDPGRIIIPAASVLDQDGNEVTIKAQAVCGEHAQGMNKRITRPAAISSPAAPTRYYDPDYTRKLEHELGLDRSDENAATSGQG